MDRGVVVFEVYVSIHAPREGCDRSRVMVSPSSVRFQFTHPGRGATRTDTPFIGRRNVSIHAPREGCDIYKISLYLLRCSFNSRTPGGVRLGVLITVVVACWFQFTHPGRGATRTEKILSNCEGVSIHAPREGCDGAANAAVNTYMQFQFTHPGRGATNCGYPEFEPLPVSIHAPREGCDPIRSDIASRNSGFNSRTPGGVRHTLSCRTIE